MDWTPDRIRQLRRLAGENTRTFGAAVGRSGRVVEDWEQGRHGPDAAARLLLTARAKRLIAARARAAARDAARAGRITR